MGNIYDIIFAVYPKYNGAIGYKLRIVLDWVKRNKFKEVLDVGSGRGHYLKLFSENGIKATGLEPSKYILSLITSLERPLVVMDISGWLLKAAAGRV